MLDICVLLWQKLGKKHFETSGIVFALMWVCIILVILALSGFAHWYFLYSSSMQSVSKVGNETGTKKPVTKAQPDMAAVTPVLVPTVSPVITVATPSPSTSSSSVTDTNNPSMPPPVTNGTSKENAGKQVTPVATATVMASPTALPTATPTPSVSPTPVPTPTPTPTPTPVPTPTPDPVPIVWLTPDPVSVSTTTPSPVVTPSFTPTSTPTPVQSVSPTATDATRHTVGRSLVTC